MWCEYWMNKDEEEQRKGGEILYVNELMGEKSDVIISWDKVFFLWKICFASLDPWSLNWKDDEQRIRRRKNKKIREQNDANGFTC